MNIIVFQKETKNFIFDTINCFISKAKNNLARRERSYLLVIKTLNYRSAEYHALAADPLNQIFNVDRRTPLGNPFSITNESTRDLACELYAAYFLKTYDRERRLLDDYDPTSLPFFSLLTDIFSKAEFGDVYLACWCAPKRCHGETIQAVINYAIERGSLLTEIPARELKRIL